MLDVANPTHRSLMWMVFNDLRSRPFYKAEGMTRRLRSAIGLLQRKDQSWREDYSSTPEHCECRDSVFRREIVCKHRIACYMESIVMVHIRNDHAWFMQTLAPLGALIKEVENDAN